MTKGEERGVMCGSPEPPFLCSPHRYSKLSGCVRLVRGWFQAGSNLHTPYYCDCRCRRRLGTSTSAVNSYNTNKKDEIDLHKKEMTFQAVKSPCKGRLSLDVCSSAPPKWGSGPRTGSGVPVPCPPGVCYPCPPPKVRAGQSVCGVTCVVTPGCGS